MDRKLLQSALTKYFLGVLAAAFLLFVPAGSLDYWNGWLFMGLLFIPVLIMGAFLIFKKPELLRKRLGAKEKETEQRAVVLLGGLLFLFAFILAGLDYRFQWSSIPNWLVEVASLIFIIAYLIYALVLRENAYLSRTVEVQEGQEVVDTGLYSIVRHPMYLATILLFTSMPLILGSWFSFLLFLAYPAIIVKRLKNEEEVLDKDLPGYTEYKKRVKYRLIPFVW